jgi:hypothetical protein
MGLKELQAPMELKALRAILVPWVKLALPVSKAFRAFKAFKEY